MRDFITKRRVGKQLFIFGVLVFVLMFLIFFLIFSSHVSADSGNTVSIHGYESVLVRPGDTLDSLAKKYATVYSHVSAGEYAEQIVRLNGLSSRYITEGVYLLMPKN